MKLIDADAMCGCYCWECQSFIPYKAPGKNADGDCFCEKNNPEPRMCVPRRNDDFCSYGRRRRAESSMNKQEILEALHIHADPHNVCEMCPYQFKNNCTAQLARDVLELLDEVTPND